MTKRKRSRSVDQSRAVPSENPFLEIPKSTAVGDDEVLRHILTFGDLSKQKKMGSKCTRSLNYLLNFLSESIERDGLGEAEASASSASLAPTEIALLLLPWALKQLLSASGTSRAIDSEARSDSSMVVWRTFVTCLEILLLAQDPTFQQTLSQKILTQSTLFKLVPKIALFAVGADEDAQSNSENSHSKPKASDRDSAGNDEISEMDSDELDSETQRTSKTNQDDSTKMLAAKAYKLITEKLFRPTLDVACKSLLLPIVAAMQLEDQYARARILAHRHTLASTDPVGETIALSTLHLINDLQRTRKGNPKTTFQLLSSRSVLLAFSRLYFFFQQDFDGMILSDIDFFEKDNEGQSLVREILNDGLFNPQHHLEGFRSLIARPVGAFDVSQDKASHPVHDDDQTERTEKKPQFQCYQEGLLRVMIEILSPSSDPEERNQVTDVRDAAWIVPVLLRGFLEQTKVWERQENDSKKKRSHHGDELPVLQFQMFMHLTSPLRSLISRATSDDETSTPAIALRSLHETLSLLFLHDAYVYSQDSQGGRQFAFLDGIATEILELNGNADDFMGLELLSDSVHILRLLAKLNYLLLHQRVVPSISFCLSCRGGRLTPQVIDFLVVVVDTYRQLREQNHLFRSVLEVLTTFAGENGVSALAFFSSLMSDPALSSAVATAVQDSPALQAKEIFETINAWILNVCGGGRADSDSTLQSFDVAVQLTVVVFRNVHVDSATSSGVASICESFINGSIQALVDGAGNGTGPSLNKLVSPALTLCGWIIDLHTRCVFWLGKSAHLAIPSEVIEIMNSASTAFRKDSGRVATGRNTEARESRTFFKPVLDELLFLASHRLQQLHFLIHEQERIELEDPGVEKTSLAYIAEAEQQASFMVEVAERQREPLHNGIKPRWTVIARSFASWAPYANEQQVEWLLNWMFSMLSIDSSSPFLPVESLGYRLKYHGLDEEIEVAKGLLCDASFVEDVKVSARLGLVALSSTAEWIVNALSRCGTGDPIVDKQLRMLASPRIGSETWTKSKPDVLADLLNTTVTSAPLSGDDRDFVITRLKRAIIPIMAFNGMQPIGSSDAAIDFVDSAFRLDHVCRALGDADSEILRTTIPLVAVLRLSIVKTIEAFPNELFIPIFGGSEDITNMIAGLFQTTKSLLPNSELGSVDEARLLDATGSLVNVLAKRCDVSQRCDFLTCVRVDDDSASEVYVNAVLGRSLLRGLEVALKRQHVDGDAKGPVDALASSLRDELWNVVSSFDIRASEEDDSLLCPRLLLFGDLIRLSTLWGISYWPDLVVKDRILDECLGSAASWPWSEEVGGALSYVVACVVKTGPSPGTQDRIIDLAGKVRKPDYLLDASFCQLVLGFDSQRLETVLEKLTREDAFYPIESRLRLVALLLRYLEKEDQLEILSNFGRRIFALILNPLHASTGGESWVANVVAASSLMGDLVRRRDVVSFKERDLALALAHISAVVGPGASDEAGGGILPLPNAVYDATTRLFSALFQRFSKQLYICVPSVVSVLHSFLRQVLYGPLSDDVIVDRSQKFTRLCELLIQHRDIYKKHLLGLLLEFIHALQNNMSLVRKKNLLPAVYCLLDSLTSYETKQLNSMMETTAKTLFRTVYQSYQKLYAYKGQ